jgi:hypothetical protein
MIRRLALVAYFVILAATVISWAPGWWRLLALVPAFGVLGAAAVTHTAAPAAPGAPLPPQRPAPGVTGGDGPAQTGRARGGGLPRVLPFGIGMSGIPVADGLVLRHLNDALGCQDWGDYPRPHYDEYDDCQCPDHVAMRRTRRE